MRSGIAGILGGVLLAQGFWAQGVFAQDVSADQAGDPAAGKVLAGQCRTCHGLNGFARIPIAPHIGGENPLYLIHQLTAFRDGSREHEMMTVVAKGLTDAAIADLAAWYASQTITATLPAGASADMAPETCVGCHGANGIALIEDAPNLAGENLIYTETQLKAFRTGKRVHDIMTPIASELTDEDMRSVAAWYEAVTLEIAPAP